MKDYYSAEDSYHSYCYMVPLSASDAGQSAYIMDALAYYGRQMIRPAYCESCLQRKLTRDSESLGMLDIIFGNVVYDLGAYADFGGLLSKISAQVIARKPVDFASLCASLKPKIDAAVDKYVAALSEN